MITITTDTKHLILTEGDTVHSIRKDQINSMVLKANRNCIMLYTNNKRGVSNMIKLKYDQVASPVHPNVTALYNELYGWWET